MSKNRFALICLCCFLPVLVTKAQEERVLRHQMEALTGVAFRINGHSNNPADILAAHSEAYAKLPAYRYSYYFQPQWGAYIGFSLYPIVGQRVNDKKLGAPFEDEYYIVNKSSSGSGSEDGGCFSLGAQYRTGKKHWYLRMRAGVSIYDLPPGENTFTLKRKGSNDIYIAHFMPGKSYSDNYKAEVNLELGVSLDYKFNNVIALTAEAGYQQSFNRNKAHLILKDQYSYEQVDQQSWKGNKLRNEFSISLGMSLLLHKKSKR